MAIVAITAWSTGKPLERGKAGSEGQQGAERTEMPAPCPAPEQFQHKNARENEKREKGKRVRGLAEWQNEVPQQGIGAIEIVPVVAYQVIKPGPSISRHLAENGVEEKGEKSDANCHGIKEACQVDAEQSGKEECKKQVVATVAPEEPGRPQFWDVFCGQIENGAQRTNPAAEKTAKHHRCCEDEDGRQEEKSEGFGCQNIGRHDKGIKAKEGVDGEGYLILAAIIGKHEKDEKKDQKQELREATEEDRVKYSAAR